MFTNKFPYFKKGNILKKEMLQNLRDYPRNFLKLYYDGYSEGIISGSDIFIEDDYICINSGIIKFKEAIYIMEDNYKINYSNTNKEIVIKLKCFGLEETADFKEYKSKIFLDDNIKLAADEFELGRFKLREGAKLRANYNNFLDFDTEYNTINIINVKYSNYDNYTLHPLIIKEFANQILKKADDSYLDLAFSMECLNSRAIDRGLMISYISKKLEIVEEEYTNFEIYTYMKRIIKSLADSRENKRSVPKRRSKIIVD